MDDKNYLEDLHDIKNLMNRSSQFLSLSGLSGVLAGVYALVGAYIAKGLLHQNSGHDLTMESHLLVQMMVIAGSVLLLSVATAMVMSSFKARRQGENLWNSTSRRMGVNFLIPLATGGVFAVLLLRQQNYGLVAPATLIFYGLACVNASKYTFRDVRYLGLTITLIGLVATAYPGYGLECWALGFGLCHIFYGGIMYLKYDRNH